MKIKKTSEKLVCDVVGCGRLADYVVVTSTGARGFFCAHCLKEAKKALKEINFED